MARPLDHLVLPCPDLGAAADHFRALGFQVGSRNRHPWGTENHIVQFPGAFIELIALGADYVPVSRDADAFPFAGFLAGQAGCAPPSGMVVLRSDDASADADAFTRLGIGQGRMLHFAREGTAADGTIKTVAFTLAFADAAGMPGIGFFVCQQHHPENFWNPASQRHPNGATALQAAVVVAEHPSAHTDFLRRFAASETDSPAIDLLSPETFQSRYGNTLPRGALRPGFEPTLAAIRVSVGDGSTVPEWIERSGRRPVQCQTGWVAAPGEVSEVALVFEGPVGPGR